MKTRMSTIAFLLFAPMFLFWIEPAMGQVAILSNSTISFGNVVVQATSTRNLSITNTGTSNLVITSIVATVNFQSSNCASATITPNGSCTVSVSFTPPLTGSSTGSLTITDNAPNSPQIVSLSATGVAAVTFSPPNLTFPNQAIGTASVAKTISVVNNQTVPLNITSVTTTGSFTASSCPATLAALASCLVSVTFTPSGLGANTGTFNVTDNANNSPQSASLTGSGVQPVTFSQMGISFGNQVVNTTSSAKTLTLTNNQSIPLNISSITATADFTASSCATPVAAYGNCPVNITFTPPTTGSLTGTLTVTDDASTSPQTASLSGIGVLSVSLSQTTLQFPSQVVGTTSSAKTVTLSNNQSTALNVTSITTTGPFAASTCPTSISPNGTCAINVTFTPSIAGNSSGTLTVVDSASSSPQTATLQGVGTAAQLISITVTPANPSTPAGTTQQFTATGNYNNGTTANLTSIATWTSSVLSVATINSAGLANALTVGSSTMSATSGTITGSTILTVGPPTLVSISITPANSSIALGVTQQFTATGVYADGSTQNLTSTGVNWSVGGVVGGNSTVGTISNTGLYSAPATTPNPPQVAIVATSTTVTTVSGSTTLTVGQILVTVSPTTFQIQPNGTQQLTANVTGTLNSAVTWSVGGVAGGNSTVGTISTTGLYTAPATVPNPPQVTVTATSTADGTTSGNSTVTISQIVVTISPATTQVEATQAQQFTATVTGTSNAGVTWSAAGVVGGNLTVGTISTSGLYTAPSTVPNPALVTITATSAADGVTGGSARVTVVPLIVVTVSPPTMNVHANATQQFTATVAGTSNIAVTWSAGGVVGGNVIIGTISSTGLYTAPALVPQPAMVTIIATSVADPTKSASAVATVIVASHVTVVVSPQTVWVVAGATQQFQASVFDSSNLNVTWSVNGVMGGNSNVGTISSSGLYTAPTTPTQVVVTATSVADPTRSGNSNVTVGTGTFSATPLVDFASVQLYLGQFSGLLYNGSNSPPTVQSAAGQTAAALVQPLDVNGNPSPSGKIVLVSLGMSNAWDEWCDSTTRCTSFSFMGQVASSTSVNHATVAVANGALYGQTTPEWACPYGICPPGSTNANNYDRVRDTILTPAGLTEAQVQVVWIKQSNPGGYAYPSLPSSSADAYGFEYQLGQVLRALKTRWPNVQQVFISSRIYAGYSKTGVNPEPYAYEYGFSVKWLINAQITQRSTGVVDPLAGDLLTAVPWIDWGPYIWGNGNNNPPGSTALSWAATDYTSDGEHPGNTGVTKVGSALMNFFLNSPYTLWFWH